MNSPQNERQLDEFIEAYLLYLEGAGAEPDRATLASELRDEAETRIDLLKASWGALVERTVNLGDDPVERRFGFDRAGQTLNIAGHRLRKARQARGIPLDSLARAVNAAGAQTTTSALFALEQADAFPVPQVLASALAAVLDCSVTELESETIGRNTSVRRFLDSHEFDDMVSGWAMKHGHRKEDVRQNVSSKLLGAAARAEEVSLEHWKEIVRTLLDEMQR